jgi:hypothetical protein
MKGRWWIVLATMAIWGAIVFASARCTPALRAGLIPVPAAERAQLEAQARALCARATGSVTLPDGVLVCTGKPARRARSVITIAEKVDRWQP